jgi:hypothetical protein
MRAWRVADIGPRLARHVPTWVPAALWCPVVAVAGGGGGGGVWWGGGGGGGGGVGGGGGGGGRGAFAAVVLVVGVAGVVLAVLDANGWRALGALWTVAVGASAAWCVEEARA